MPYLITKNGDKQKLDLEINKIVEESTIVSEYATLRKIFILNLYRGSLGGRGESEFIKSIEFLDHKPTEEQIIYSLATNGLSRYDFATIEEGLMMDFVDFFGNETNEHFPISKEDKK